MGKFLRKNLIKQVDEAHYMEGNNGTKVLFEDFMRFRFISKVHSLDNSEKQASIFNTEYQFYILDFNDDDTKYYLIDNNIGIELLEMSYNFEDDEDDDYFLTDGLAYILYQLKLISKKAFDEASVEEYLSVNDGSNRLNESTRKLIGHVGVDSGQLMIIDPCYIKEQWREDGETIGLRFWGKGENDVAEILGKQHDIKEKNGTYQILSNDMDYIRCLKDEITKTAKSVDKIVVTSLMTNSSYDRVCDITTGENSGGSLPYAMGHEGLAVAFSSGFGDGFYEVYAHYRNFGEFGTRITKVEIELIGDEENEENNTLLGVINNYNRE